MVGTTRERLSRCMRIMVENVMERKSPSLSATGGGGAAQHLTTTWWSACGNGRIVVPIPSFLGHCAEGVVIELVGVDEERLRGDEHEDGGGQIRVRWCCGGRARRTFSLVYLSGCSEQVRRSVVGQQAGGLVSGLRVVLPSTQLFI
jgi:hypothetical protein